MGNFEVTYEKATSTSFNWSFTMWNTGQEEPYPPNMNPSSFTTKLLFSTKSSFKGRIYVENLSKPITLNSFLMQDNTGNNNYRVSFRAATPYANPTITGSGSFLVDISVEGLHLNNMNIPKNTPLDFTTTLNADGTNAGVGKIDRSFSITFI